MSMTSMTKFYHVTEIILQIWSCNQSLVNLAFLWPKNAFFEGWSWFKFNNLALKLDTDLRFYTSVAKGLKLNFRKFWGIILTFVEVTSEKMVGGGGHFAPAILNKVNRL